MKRKVLTALGLLLFVCSLLTVPVRTDYTGSKGTAGDPFIITNKNYNAGNFRDAANNIAHFSKQTESGATISSSSTVRYDNSGITGITVAGGEYVTLQVSMPATVTSAGHLTIKASGVAVTGDNSAGNAGYVTVNAADATLRGTINTLDGSYPVKVSGTAAIDNGGSGTVTGGSASGADLTINGGSMQIQGMFKTLTLGSSATAVVSGNTYIGNNGLTGTGKITVNGGVTLTVGAESITPLSSPVTFTVSSWGKLVSGDYNYIAGSWTVNDGTVSVKGTAKGSASNPAPQSTGEAGDTPVKVTGGATFVLGGGSAQVQGVDTTAFSLTVQGGTAVLLNATTIDNLAVSGGVVTLASTATINGDMTVQGGTVTLTQATIAKDLTVSSGELKVSSSIESSGEVSAAANCVELGANAQITCNKDGSKRSIRNTADAAVRPGKWDSTGAYLNGNSTYTVTLTGAWILPTEYTANVTGGDGGTTVIGTGGTVKVVGDNVHLQGYFDTITSENQAFSIDQGKALCDKQRSVTLTNSQDSSNSSVSITNWTSNGEGGATLPGNNGTGSDSAVSYANVTGDWTLNGNVFINGATFTCAGDGHAHSGATLYGSGTAYVQGSGTIESKVETVAVIIVGLSHIVGTGNSITLSQNAFISGTFATITGSTGVAAYLEGNTTITGNGSNVQIVGGEQASSAGQYCSLTINDKSAQISVSGHFASLQTVEETSTDAHTSYLSADGKHVKMVGDTTIDGGVFGLYCEDAALTLTINGGGTSYDNSSHIAGTFKQVNVTDGYVRDCGTLTLNNTNAPALRVTGGTVVLDDTPSIAADGSSVHTVDVISGGQLAVKNGTISTSGTYANGVYVSGENSRFWLGKENNTTGCVSVESSKMTVTSGNADIPQVKASMGNSICVSATSSGEAWLYDGEIYFTGKDGYGVNATENGHVHLWSGDLYGERDVDHKILLYVHGNEGSGAAMYVGSNGKFDIRGRGVLLEEPYQNSKESQFALYIANDAAIDEGSYPISGGTFWGKVWYVQNDVSTLIAPNHYLRYVCAADNESVSRKAQTIKSAMEQMKATDGTYGLIQPSHEEEPAYSYGSYAKMHNGGTIEDKVGFRSKNKGASPENVTDCFGEVSGIVAVTDAEWELRQKMNEDGGEYQLPAGIVQNSTQLILDYNCVAPENESYRCLWGAGKKQGSLTMKQGNATLYLAGRELVYTGKNYKGIDLRSTGGANDITEPTVCTPGETESYTYADPYVSPKTNLQTIWINLQTSFSMNEKSVLTIRDSVLAEDGGLQVNGDKQSGGYIGTGAVNYTAEGVTAPRTVYVSQGKFTLLSAQINKTDTTALTGIYNHGGTVQIGNPDDENENQLIRILMKTDTKTAQAVYASYNGTVNINSGVVGDTANACTGYGVNNDGGTLNVYDGIITGSAGGIRNSAGTTNMTGGCVYGKYVDDSGETNSILVEGGTFDLKINEAHRNYLGTVPTAAQSTKDCHHIRHVTVKGGTLNVRNDSRINGKLTCTCVSGGESTTNFYNGIVLGETVVKGMESASGDLYGTRFYVRGGNFHTLRVVGSKTYSIADFSQRVQLHGGTFTGITVEGEGFMLESNKPSPLNVLGFWSNDVDLDEDGDKTDDWVGYNHYATEVSATRSEALATYGVWSDSDVSTDDENRAWDGVGAVSNGMALTVRNAYTEFAAWCREGGTFALPTNLWLYGANTMATYTNAAPTDCYHTSYTADLPKTVSGGTLKMNNWGIFGSGTGALLEAGSGATLTVASASDASDKPFANLLRNIGSGYALDWTDGGELTLTGSSANALRFRSADGENVYAIVTGSAPMAGEHVHMKSGLQASGDVSLSSCEIKATGTGVNMIGGKLEGTSVSIDSKDGIQASGDVSLSSCTITATDTGIKMTVGKLEGTSVSIDSKDGIQASGDVSLSGCTVTASGNGVKLAGGKLQRLGDGTDPIVTITATADGLVIDGDAEIEESLRLGQSEKDICITKPEAEDTSHHALVWSSSASLDLGEGETVASVKQSSGSITLAGGTVSGNYDLSAGTLDVRGATTEIKGTLKQSGGTVTFTGEGGNPTVHAFTTSVSDPQTLQGGKFGSIQVIGNGQTINGIIDNTIYGIVKNSENTAQSMTGTTLNDSGATYTVKRSGAQYTYTLGKGENKQEVIRSSVDTSTGNFEQSIVYTDNNPLEIAVSAKKKVTDENESEWEPISAYTVAYQKKSGETWSALDAAPTDAGTYKATVTSDLLITPSNGSNEIEYKIAPKSIEDKDVSVSSVPTQLYTGSPVTPEPKLQYGDYTLVKDTDYTLAYENNTNSGTATITITANGNNFTGTRTVNFTIRAGSSSSGGAGTTDQTANVPISVGNEEESVSVTVSRSGEATVPDISELLDQSGKDGANTAQSLTVDLSTFDGVSVSSAKISAKTIASVAEAVSGGEETTSSAGGTSAAGGDAGDAMPEAKGLEMVFTGGSVSFDAAALGTITAEAAADVTISMDTNAKLTETQAKSFKEIKTEIVVSLSLSSGKKTISDFKGGYATVTLPLPKYEDRKDEGYRVWYVSSDGATESVRSVVRSGNILFTLEHFSDYVVTYEEPTPLTWQNCARGTDCLLAAYNDLKVNEWYHDGVHWALESGVMRGGDDKLFHPNESMTRVQAAIVLWNLAGSPAVSEMTRFTDVKDSAWYAPPIRWAASEGIITGFDRVGRGEFIFDPDAPLTREQFAAMLYRYAQKNGHGFTGAWMFPLNYPDAAQVEEWAYEPLCWLTTQGIISGTDEGKLNPKGSAARAQVAVMLQRFHQLLNSGEG